MKAFIYKTLFTALPVLVILISVNYFGDAARLFGNDYEKKMVEIINNGKNVTNIQNYDERLFQKELILHGTMQPDLVIIGSSRTMLLRSDFFPGHGSLQNNSVSGASIEDLVSLYQLYKEKGKLPSRIIIGIDPWTFNDKNGQKRWTSIGDYFYKFQNVVRKESLQTFRYKQLFSFSYFQSSIKELPLILKGNADPQPTTQKLNITRTLLPDGSLVYGKSYREASAKEIEDKIKSYINGNIYSIENFKTISDTAWAIFEKLIIDMKANGIEVGFFLTPYAPLVYEKVASKYPMVLRTENLIKKYAADHNIKLYGSFDPGELEMDNSYFYDGMHCTEIGIKKIIEVAREGN